MSDYQYPPGWEEPEDEELYSDDEFTKICADRAKYAALSEVEQETARRWAEIEALREHYALFEDFLYDCMTELMGFECSPQQIDIGEYLASDVQEGMIQAQRSQAKSTIVAIFAVWTLIHNCRHRVLIISAASDVAMEIANWTIQIIMNWDVLECMRPDRQHGDRASTKAFDIHWQLKGAEKSPSVACIGVTANMQGRRADLLVPDDIESSKNGLTEIQREALLHKSRDFTSICQSGRIIYLGTPQTVDSIYNSLPDRGYDVRIWPGRFPTEKELPFYGDRLAPFIRKQIEADPSLQTGGGIDGTRGKPTDPVIQPEERLTKKELDQGPEYFDLQYMLNTELSDDQRHPLKAKDLIVMNVPLDKAPGEITWLPSPDNQIKVSGYSTKMKLYRPFSVSPRIYEYEGRHMYVDTAGGGANGDETVAAVTYFLHGYVFLAGLLKMPGGYGDAKYKELSEFALLHRVNQIEVEKNFGFGAFAAAWRPVLASVYKENGEHGAPSIEDVWEAGQKELRIIDTLGPIMARHRLIINEYILEYDVETANKYSMDKRESYKFMHQLVKLTRDKGALIHDDCIDAVAGSCRHWVDSMAVDEQIRMEQKTSDENVDFFNAWGAKIGNTKVLGNSRDRFTKRALTHRNIKLPR